MEKQAEEQIMEVKNACKLHSLNVGESELRFMLDLCNNNEVRNIKTRTCLHCFSIRIK